MVLEQVMHCKYATIFLSMEYQLLGIFTTCIGSLLVSHLV